MAAGRLTLADVVTHLTDLDGIGDALERLRRGDGARTVAILDRDLAGEAAGAAIATHDHQDLLRHA